MSSLGKRIVSGAVILGVLRLGIACVGTDSVSPGPAPAPDAGSDAPVDNSLGRYPGDPGSLNELTRSGSRLVAQFEDAGGVRRFKGFFDPQLDATCEFLIAPNGNLYCFPATFNFVLPGLYADGACTQPAIALDDCQAAEPFVLKQNVDSCPPTVVAYRRGNAVSPFTNIGVDGCKPTTKLTTPAYELGAAIDPDTELVRGDLAAITNDGGAGIVAYRVIGEDGSEAFFTIRDAQGADCAISRRTGGLRCLPQLAPFSFGFVGYPSSACATGEDFPLAAGPQCSGSNYAISAPQAGCSVDDKFYDIVRQVDDVWSLPTAGAACTKVDFVAVFEINPQPVPLEKFPAATELPILPNVRLQPRRFAFPDGTRGALNSNWDAELNVECTFGVAEDGKTRCLPFSASVEEAYEDAACATPALKLARYEARCYVEAPTFAAEPIAPPAGTCTPPANKMYRMGALRSGALFIKNKTKADACEPAPAAPRAPLLEVVDPSRFVELSPVPR